VDPGRWLPFPEAVVKFDTSRFVGSLRDAGAKYLIFTATHALQMLPAPCREIEAILPGRTTKRDLIADLIKACDAAGLHFILYYNHSCNHGDDPAWETAVGYHAKDKTRLAENLCVIIRHISMTYGQGIKAYWFDSCFSLDGRGPIDTVTTDMGTFQFPWAEWVASAKAGFEGRLVTLSAGMLSYFLYSERQDYEAGEANDLVSAPSSQFTIDGVQSHRWICLDNPDWVHSRWVKPLASPRYRLANVIDYVRVARHFQVPVTFNLDIDQTGAMNSLSLDFLRNVAKQVS
jgi:hypothetical protein